MARNPKTGAKSATATSTAKPVSDKVVVCLNLAHSVVFEIDGRKIRINGQNENLRGEQEGILAVGKFGQSIIDRQDWEEIRRQYGRMSIFKMGLIFAQKDTASANAEAREKKELRHGLEPVDPEKTVSKADSEK